MLKCYKYYPQKNTKKNHNPGGPLPEGDNAVENDDEKRRFFFFFGFFKRKPEIARKTTSYIHFTGDFFSCFFTRMNQIEDNSPDKTKKTKRKSAPK